MNERPPDRPATVTATVDEVDAARARAAADRLARAARSARRTEWAIAACFVAAAAAGVALAVVYWTGGQPQAEGILLGVVLGGIGVGLAAWAKRFLPTDERTEERPPPGSTDEDVAAFAQAFEAGEVPLQRRKLLGRLLLGAFGALAVALVFPIRSLGPRPGIGLSVTPYRGGRRLVDRAGEPIAADRLQVGSVLTAWPDVEDRPADSSTLVIRLGADVELGDGTRAEWVVDGIVAYSKLCTHTGCPVGLYQQQEHLLLCPCHQSTFDVVDGARPVFGPAVRPLPQLPLGVDGDGNLVATGDFEEPTGAGYWDLP